MQCNKTSRIIAYAACGAVAAIAACLTYKCAHRAVLRHNLMRQCGVGMDCDCFANIIRNRMSRNDMRIFARFMDAVRVRPNVNILEFTDDVTASRIFTTVSLCRVKTESESNNTQQKAKK